MPTPLSLTGSAQPARIHLKTYTAELPLGSLVIGVDNIHHDVYLSPRWTDQTRTYLLEFTRQTINLNYFVQKDGKPAKAPEHAAWRKELQELLQTSLTNAKFQKRIELDLLLRVAVLKFLTQEIGAQFANVILEAKDWIRKR